MIINNYSGLSTHNTESEATFTSHTPPVLLVKQFDPRIAIGNSLTVPYYVSDFYMKDKTLNRVGDTFTVEVVVNGVVVSRKTTFAGDSFININTGSYTDGEYMFGIHAIDESGVGSPMEYFHILVETPVTKTVGNTKVLTADDFANAGYSASVTVGGTTYNLVDLVDTAAEDLPEAAVKQGIKNKAAFTTVLAAAKAGGYKFIDFPAGQTYVFDVHRGTVDGDTVTIDTSSDVAQITSTNNRTILWPDDVTVDMNGCTFRMLQATDVNYNTIIHLFHNTNTHIKNGYIIGLLDKVDVDDLPESGANLRCCQIESSKFCSIEDMDISLSLGYDNGFGGSITKNTNYWYVPSGNFQYKNVAASGDTETFVNGYIDFDGEETAVADEEWGMTNYLSMSGIYGTSGNYESDRTKLDLCHNTVRITANRETSGDVHWPIIVVAFYAAVGEHIRTVKTSLDKYIEVPSGAMYMRICVSGTVETGYDYTATLNNLNTRVVDSKTGTASYPAEYLPTTQAGYSHSCCIKNCYIHSERTCGAGPHYSHNCVDQFNKYEDMGLLGLNGTLGDAEDGVRQISTYYFDHNEFVSGVKRLYAMNVGYCLHFTNNVGVTLKTVNAKGMYVRGNLMNGGLSYFLQAPNGQYTLNKQMYFADNIGIEGITTKQNFMTDFADDAPSVEDGTVDENGNKNTTTARYGQIVMHRCVLTNDIDYQYLVMYNCKVAGADVRFRNNENDVA